MTSVLRTSFHSILSEGRFCCFHLRRSPSSFRRCSGLRCSSWFCSGEVGFTFLVMFLFWSCFCSICSFSHIVVFVLRCLFVFLFVVVLVFVLCFVFSAGLDLVVCACSGLVSVQVAILNLSLFVDFCCFSHHRLPCGGGRWLFSVLIYGLLLLFSYDQRLGGFFWFH